MKKISKLFYMLLACLTISGCGFHLRGYETIPSALHILYLETPSPYDPFTTELRNALKSMKIIVVKTPQQAPLTLEIINVAFNLRLTSISANTQVRTYILSYTLAFELKKANGEVIYGPMVVVSSEPYSTSDTQLLGDAQELTIKKRLMQQDLINKLCNHLNSREGQQALRQNSLN